MKRLILFALLISGNVFSQKSEGFRIDSLQQGGILLDKGWKWHAGDNPDFAKPDFDDSAWEGIDPTKTIPQLDQIDKNKPLWLRTKLTSQINQEVVLSIAQSGASEIFLNGNRVLSFGQIEGNNQSTVAYDPQNDAFILKLGQPKNTLAVRYYFQDKLRYNSVFNINFPLFSASINNKVLKSDFGGHVWNGFNIGVPFILFIVHFIFFLSYPKNKANLWYSLSSLFGFVIAFLLFKLETTHSIEFKNQLTYYAGGLGVLQNTLLYFTMYIFLKQKNLWLVVVFATGSILGVILNYFDYFQSSVLFNYLLTTFYVSSVIYMGNQARKQGEKGGKFLIVSMVLYIIFWSLFIFSYNFGWGTLSSAILFHLAVLILPVIISALLGLDFRNTNNLLIKNLEKINILSAEKQQILSTQNETLEKQVADRTAELVHKNRDLEIEAALERVRSRTMAMHNSDQLAGVMSVLCKEILNLGIHSDNMETCYITTFESTQPVGEIYLTTSNGDLIPHSFRARYDEEYYFKQIFETWKKGDSSFFLHAEGDELLKHFAFLYTSIPQDSPIIQLRSEDHRQLPSELFNYILYFSQGYLDVVTRIAVPEYFEVFKRFGGALQQAYTRFLDLQKAENQAREAQIEAALERVRSRSMAMHKSDELVEVINVVAEQLIQLNFRINTASFFLNNESEEFTFWLAAIGESNPDKIVIPKSDNPALNNIKEARRKGLDFFADTLTFEEKNEWFQHVFDHSVNDRISEERKEFILNTAGYARSLVLMKEIGLFICNYLPQPYSDAENAILIRFAKVFEQAYTRFLDLQKAEAQAREAQIEAALEKIRSRSLAMHNSGELNEVVSVMSEKLRELNVLIDSVSIQLFDEKNKNSFFWVGSELNDKPRMIYLPYDEKIFFEDTYLKDSWQAKINDEDIINKTYSFEQKNKYFEYVFDNNDLTVIPQPIRGFIKQAPSHTTCLLVEKNSSLFVDSWDGRAYSEDMLKVLKRASVVFEQAYVRFLDLQKAESQAREAQIEVALERVRSKTLAMQSSEELSTIIGLIYTEMGKLDILLDRCFFMIFDPKTLGAVWWMGSPEDGDLSRGYYLQYHEHAPHLACLKGWKERKERWTYLLEGEVKSTWDAFCFGETELASLPKIVIDNMRSVKRINLSASYYNFGCLMTATFEPLKEESFDILVRFSKVFDLTYTRFSDLQKAEEQAREAQIEVALEKIRSRSLAMHHSDELKEVMGVMFKKLTELEILIGTVGVLLFDEKTKNCDFWLQNQHQEPGIARLPYDEKLMNEDNYMRNYWEAKSKGESFFNKKESIDQKNRHFEYVFAHNDMPQPIQEYLLQAQHHTQTFIVEKNSALLVDSWDERIYSEEQIGVLKRVAKVFEQAYIRFLDLQKAEAQAREAQIEVALERVRARAMSMQKSDELADAAQILYHEFGKLGINTFTCGYMFIDETKQKQTAWVTLPDGTILPNFIDFPLMGDHVLDKRYDSWKSKKPLHIQQVEGKENKTHHDFLAKHVPKNVAKDIFEQIPESIIFYSANFSNGYLLILATDFFSTEEEQIIIRFTKVFELTYTRFLDLELAESQAREAKIEVALERVRSKTLAMQSSGELSTIIGLIYNEMGTLNVQLQRCFFMIFNPQNLGVTWWMASGESLDLGQGYFVPYSEHRPQMAYLKGWQGRQEAWHHHMQGEEKAAWDTFLFHDTELKTLPPFIIDNMKSYKSIHLEASFNSFGCLTTGNEQPLSNEAFDLLIRFSKVFDLTYTRFNDITVAEAQAEQAHRDLIQIQTEKKRAEEALIVLKATQTQLIQSEKLASLGELTAGIAHEIQNPLNFVNNFSELNVELLEELKAERQKAEGKRDFELEDELLSDLSQNQEKINHHGKRASSIVKGMLEHSRKSTGEKELTDINALADEYLKLSYHGLRAKDSTFNSDFKTDFDQNLAKVEVIPQDFGRVLLNLINNAFYATIGVKNPMVEIKTENVENGVIVRIKDNGTGMSEETKAKIFQPFFTTKPTGEGTGLGLSLAYDIVTKGHGGTIEVESVEGEGSEFRIKLLFK